MHVKNRSQLKKNSIIGLFASVVILFGFFITIYAQEFLNNQVLEVSPPSQEIQLNPGESITVETKVRNRSAKTLPIKVRIEDFTATGSEGQVALVKQDAKYSLVSWSTVEPGSFSLSPNEERTVLVKLSVPRDAAGGRYGSVVFGVASSEKEQKQTGSAVSQEIASLFLVKVNGPATENLTLNKFTAPQFAEFGPVSLAMTFKNSGNVHVRTYGLIAITDMFGNKTKDVLVTPTNVFPGAERVVRTNFDKKFLFGRYTALAVMNYGSKNESLGAAVSFIVVPVRYILLGLLIILVLYKLRKRINKAFRAFS